MVMIVLLVILGFSCGWLLGAYLFSLTHYWT
jgi:hypothetical protein